MRLYEGLYREDGPPTDLADRISASFPNNFVRLLHQRMTKDIAEADKYVFTLQSRVNDSLRMRRHILDGLRKVGFKLTFGEDGSGVVSLLWTRLGGYYFGMAPDLVVMPTIDRGQQMSGLRRRSSMGKSN